MLGHHPGSIRSAIIYCLWSTYSKERLIWQRFYGQTTESSLKGYSLVDDKKKTPSDKSGVNINARLFCFNFFPNMQTLKMYSNYADSHHIIKHQQQSHLIALGCSPEFKVQQIFSQKLRFIYFKNKFYIKVLNFEAVQYIFS